MSAPAIKQQQQIPLPGNPTTSAAAGLGVSRISLGLMGMTWTDPSQFTPDDQAFAVIRRSIHEGGVTLLDAGQFYGPQSDPHANLKLVKRYFDKYPDDKDKVLLCVKGGFDLFSPGGYAEKGFAGMNPLTDLDKLRESVKLIRQELGSDAGGKDIDLWEPARYPKNVDVGEMTRKHIALRDEGLFRGLALSEVGGKTIREAWEASKGGVAAVEIEYSAFCLEAEEQGVLAACEEFKIPILAYSPVGKGFLTGTITSRSEIPEGDLRLRMDQYAEENFQHNVDVADKLKAIAKEKGVTASQLALAWILARSPIMTAIPGTRQPDRAIENAAAAEVKLTQEDLKEIADVLEKNKPKGGRAFEHARQHMNLWA